MGKSCSACKYSEFASRHLFAFCGGPSSPTRFSRRQQPSNSRRYSCGRIAVVLRCRAQVGVPQRAARSVNPIAPCQERPILFSQRMQRLSSIHSLLPEPSHQPVKDCVAPVVLPGFAWCRRTPALNHKCSFDSFVVPSKNVHHFTVDGEIGHRILAFRMKVTSRLNADHVFVPPERRPLQ